MREWLSHLEEEYQIDILFAGEAGSRAWGIANEQSDYDIRFIYRQRDLKKYLSLKKDQAVIELKSPYDIEGFDVYKAFELVLKSNPSIYEWSFSAIIYQDDDQFLHRLKQIIVNGYSPFSLYQHYSSLKRRNLKDVKRGDNSVKKQKKLIQAVRAELICLGILHTKLVLSPFELMEQAADLCPELSAAYQKLSNAKRNNLLLNGTDVISIIGLLDFSLEENAARMELPKIQPAIDELELWLWELLGVN